MDRFLVGLDGSPRAEGVLAAAIALAKRTGGKLVLVRSVGLPPEMPAHVWKLDAGTLLDDLQAHAKRDLDELAKRVPKDLLEAVRIEVAVPWQGICEAAKHVNADLVIIGSHGYGGLDRLLGTTAAKVVNHADRSVLVVRGP